MFDRPMSEGEREAALLGVWPFLRIRDRAFVLVRILNANPRAVADAVEAVGRATQTTRAPDALRWRRTTAEPNDGI